MNKKINNIILWLLLFVYATVLFGCGHDEDPKVDEGVVPSDTSDAVSETTGDDSQKYWKELYEEFVVPLWADDLQNETDGASNRLFIDEVYSVDILLNVLGEKEILKYTFNDFIYNYDRELPVIYQYIKGLNVSKEDFVKANEMSKEYNMASSILNREDSKIVYTDKQIKALYSDDKESLFNCFGNRIYYYFDGKIYSYYELISLNDKQMEKLLYTVDIYRSRTILDYFYPYRGEVKEVLGITYNELNLIYRGLELKMVYSIDDYYQAGASDFNLGCFVVVKGAEDKYPGVEGGEEMSEYYTNSLMDKTPAELDYLPEMYHLVEKFLLRDRKDEFYAYNEHLKTVYVEGVYHKHLSDEFFDLWFEEHSKDDIIKNCKSPAAFYFEGALYVLKDLKSAEESLIDMMGETVEFKEYLLGLEELFVYQRAKDEYGSLVDGWLEKYYGIK